MEMAATSFLDEDKVQTLIDLLQSLDRKCIPSGFLEMSKDEELHFVYHSSRDGQMRVAASLLIKSDLSFKMWVCDIKIPKSEIQHIMALGEKFNSCGEVLNVLAYLKSLAEEGIPERPTIASCCASLEALLPDVDNEAIQRKLGFIIEQLNLLFQDSRRQYTGDLLATAAMWLNTSPALYKRIQEDNLLTLPSVRHLKRLTSGLNVETGLESSTIRYLKERVKLLSPKERMVSVIIDKVYCAKRVEFSGGRLYGLENNEATKTLLCFFISSLAGSYRDMVAMVPVTKLDAQLINDNFQLVLKTLEIVGFDVLAVSVDGYSANRKFYETLLCSGNMKQSIPHPHPHPTHKSKDIHLLFDTTHLYKNFYSNFINRGTFHCPPFPGMTETEIVAKFSHIQQLYKKELGLSVKVAHKLTEKVLSPHSIEKTNVMLAERLFHNSTIAGLEFYSEEHPEWPVTATFLKIIRKWWNIVSVRNMSVGFHKRDDTKKPVTQCQQQLQYLKDFAEWLRQWQENGSKKTSLSSETFFCALQTSQSLPSLAKYLLDKKSLNYVLLGKASSDPIERRFGQYRQLSGANFYVSVRQILESEKLIRVKSLIKFNKLSLPDIKEVFADQEAEAAEHVEVDSQAVVNLLEMEDFSLEQSTGDEAVIYYVSGYIAKSLMKKTTCNSCSELLGDKAGPVSVQFADDVQEQEEVKNAKQALIELVNRGGLVAPSDLLHTFCTLAHSINNGIFQDTGTRQALLSSRNPHDVFVSVVLKLVANQTTAFTDTKCTKGHSVSPLLKQAAGSFSNVMMKNFVSKHNDELHRGRKRGHGREAVSRKVRKLQSNN